MTDHIVKLELNLSSLNEVNVISLVSEVVDQITWLIKLLLEMLTRFNYLLNRPVAKNRHFLQKLLAHALPIHFVDTKNHVEAGFCAKYNFGVFITDNCEISFVTSGFK